MFSIFQGRFQFPKAQIDKTLADVFVALGGDNIFWIDDTSAMEGIAGFVGGSKKHAQFISELEKLPRVLADGKPRNGN